MTLNPVFLMFFTVNILGVRFLLTHPVYELDSRDTDRIIFTNFPFVHYFWTIQAAQRPVEKGKSKVMSRIEK